MQKTLSQTIIILCLLLLPATRAHAEFTINSAIVEFTSSGARQQDIELINNSSKSDYIVSEISEIVNPGLPQESRRFIANPGESGLLVTPDKTILAGGSRKVLRFILLHEQDNEEHIYRVAVKPVVKGINTDDKVGLKILIGYEVLVIVRPRAITSSYEISRQGKMLSVTNSGNVNILLHNGVQCAEKENCKVPPTARIYAGQTLQVELPEDKPITYSIWDGKDSTEKKVD